MKKFCLYSVSVAVCILYSVLLSAQDPWIITAEHPLEGDYYGITSANGQIGLVSSRNPLQVDKLVIGGLYDIYGAGRVNNYFPNINPLDIEIKVDGAKISKSNISSYQQQLNFRNSAFTGSFEHKDKIQVQYTTMALRQMPFGFMTDVTLIAKQDCEITALNQHRAPEALRDPQAFFSRVDNKANPFMEQYPYYQLMTTTAKSPTGRYDITATTAFLFPEINHKSPIIFHREDRGVGKQTMEFATMLHAGDTLRFCVVGSIIASNVVPDTRNEAERLTLFQLLEGYDRLVRRHNEAWNELWQSDILIEGDPQAQQDIHSMLYHHYAFFRDDNPASCSPMGLSGLGYNGHAFWDGETWMFPVLAVMQPTLAKQMLQYRFNYLPQAQCKAYLYGYKGALYPWQSAIGYEETPPSHPYSALEHHVTGDIAIACWQYYAVTQDKQWLAEVGYPILRETADFWVSRVEKEADGSLHLRNLCGADEWNTNAYGGKQINDNAYTIGVAKTNLLYAAQAAKILGIKSRPEWTDTEKNLHYCYMPDGLIAEHETYNGEPIKQADVALLAFPLHQLIDRNDILRHIDYYSTKVPQKRTPAMGHSIAATIRFRLGDAIQGTQYFRESYLPNLNPPFRVIAEFNGGTNPYFITGAGGTLQSLLFGAAGLDITDKGLKQSYKPVLPVGWTKMTIRRQGEKDIVIQGSANSDTHRFATYNVRYVHPKNGDTGEKFWGNRRQYVLQNVLDNRFDIVGMQEVTGNNKDSVTGKSQLQDLQDGLKGYACIAYERSDKNYSYNAIFYRTDRYECLEHSSFWLTDTPQKVSKSWGSNFYRRCIVAKMRDKHTGKDFWFADAHTDYEPLEAGIQQAQLLADTLPKIANGLPIVFVGDLNHDKYEKPEIYKQYRKAFLDSSDGDFPTFTWWMTTSDPDFHGLQIDYLFYQHMIPLHRHIITTDYGRSVAPSDHFPVYVDFKL